MEKALHGRTLATLSATGSRKVQAGFEPLVPGFVRVPYNDEHAVRQAADANRNIVAVLVEALQGEGGINVSDPDYVRGLRRICDERSWLLMIDEVQSGLGRTGKWFVYQHAGIAARRHDAREGPRLRRAGRRLRRRPPRRRACSSRATHGSTFGGDPLACAAALATFDAIKEEGLLDHAARVGEAIRAGFRDALAGVSGVVDIRGMGLMIGIELDRPCGDLVKRALDAGLLINVTAERVIRLLPPLVISEAEARALVDGLAPVIRAFLARPA